MKESMLRKVFLEKGTTYINDEKSKTYSIYKIYSETDTECKSERWLEIGGVISEWDNKEIFDDMVDIIMLYDYLLKCIKIQDEDELFCKIFKIIRQFEMFANL